MRDIQTLCARNNAEFCDRICRSHGVPGRFERSLWIQEQKGPALYPNLVTLTHDDRAEQTAHIAALRARNPDIAVKDSFGTLDLADIGMRSLFDAEWIWMTAEPSADVARQSERWGKIDSAADLAHWQAAWRGNQPPLAKPVFLPDLLDDPAIRILAAWRGPAIVAGCVLNRDRSDIVGVSNVFAIEDDRERLTAATVARAVAFAAGSMLVGYESGDDLARMLACGFRSAGPLRVWV